jgi:hypothetical protein
LQPETLEECESLNCNDCAYTCPSHELSRFLICEKCGYQMTIGNWFVQGIIDGKPIQMRKIECTNGKCNNYRFQHNAE